MFYPEAEDEKKEYLLVTLVTFIIVVLLQLARL